MRVLLGLESRTPQQKTRRKEKQNPHMKPSVYTGGPEKIHSPAVNTRTDGQEKANSPAALRKEEKRVHLM